MGSYDSQYGFRTIQSFVPDYCPNRVTQFESERTGMRVIVVDQEGPKLNGYFTLATEIHDDSGAPHTLEHLCFMGSKSYRYKGFLDKLATRAYSSTNAWTATDHTAYTLDTAGWAGFRQILPVYLEHVILPTLTDAGCLTEVHHIDGSGLDAGVVYSEMQGVQNTAAELMSLKAKQILYPEGIGFRYETGGMMEPLRVLTADRIRQFHRDMYQPKNLCVALFGEFNHEELLQTLSEFEDSIVSDIPSPGAPFTRPWIESKPVEPLTKTTIETVEFPEDDESMGQVDIYFLGPNCANTLETAAMNVVLLYLAGSPAALLDNTIVEKEQLASGVYYNMDYRPMSEIAFSLSGIETGQLNTVEQRFFEVLKEAMSKDLDMKFMKDCIERQVRSIKFLSESSMTAFAEGFISDYLFGKRDGSTLGEMFTLKRYSKDLVGWSQKQWKDFMNKYIVDAHHVSIVGKPSTKLSEKLKQEEASRIEEQIGRLGPEGLAACAKKLEEAKAENDKEIPSKLLAKFPVPSTSSIHFVTTAAARAGPALMVGRPSNKYQSIIDENAKDMPLFIDFEHIQSNFVRIHLIMSTENIPVELRPLLSIYFEAFFNLPVKRDGKIIDFETVVQELERETVGYDIDVASSLGNTECLRIAYQVEARNYQFAIGSIMELLYDSVFDVERLKAINARLLADIPDAKRSGESMLTAAHLMVHLAPESISRAKTTLTEALYLKRIKFLLKTNPEKVVEMLEKLRTSLCQYGNFRLNIIADLEQLPEPVSSWNPFVSLLSIDPKNPPALNPLGSRINRLSEAGKNLGSSPSMIIPMATIDSSYANAVTSGPTSYIDPSLPVLIVAMAYMNAVEGPLWAAVRGTGLAYGTNMSYDVQSGFVYLDVYRSPDAYKAYQASHNVIKGHIDGTIPFDPLMLEGAISSVVVGFANEQATLASAAAASFVREIIKELPSDYTETLLGKVKDVTVEQIKDILDTVVFDLFRPGKADVLITCAVGLKEQIESGLQSLGFKTRVEDLAWFQDDYGLKDGEDEQADDDDQAAEGTDDDDDEEEDDEDET